MKKIIYLVVAGQLLLASCNDNTVKDKTAAVDSPSVNKTLDNTTSSPYETEETGTKTILAEPKDSLDMTFIEKTTIALNKYNFHSCFGAMLSGKTKDEEFAISQFSLKVDDCQNGKSKIVLEKFLNYYDKGKANFVVKDELTVYSNCPKKCFASTWIEHNVLPTGNYLLEYEDNSKEILANVYKVWRIDLEKMKLVNVEIPKNFTCNNPYYADGL